jgi:hypothetical protein
MEKLIPLAPGMSIYTRINVEDAVNVTHFKDTIFAVSKIQPLSCSSLHVIQFKFFSIGFYPEAKCPLKRIFRVLLSIATLNYVSI